MTSILKFITLLLLFSLAVGQPPESRGRDRRFFGPLRPRRGGRRGICRRLQIRTLTGRCTHRFDETLGEARRVHFSYFNVNSRNMAGAGLRSPRKISNIVCDQDRDVFSARNLNDLLTFFGQFIDHNVVLTPLSDEEAPIPPDSGEHEVDTAPEGEGEEGIDAAPEGEGEEESDAASEDEEEGLPFRRSMRDLTGDGNGERPINILTSAIDLVAVYGPNELRNKELRVSSSCKLETSPGDLLPFNTRGFANSPSEDRPEFYLAGDTRSNEHPVLTSLHTLWVREHNFLCDALAEKFRFFSPERLYETARRINIAQFQKIVYEEFFPAVTGRSLRRYRGFRRRSDPTLSSLFSTAAFRVGHTMVSEVVTQVNEVGEETTTPLRDFFFVPGSVKDGIDSFIRGAAQTKAQEIDVLVVDSLRNFLFIDVPEEEGPDLIALNLQRNRDHNIPSFNVVRRRFRIRPARTFSDITKDPIVRDRLAKAYDSVDDVEPWIGMMAEDKMPSSSMGITMFRVWEQEFLRLRDGDQFFYLGRKGLPNFLNTALPQIINPIRTNGANILRDIILRNTGIAPEDLNEGNIFQASN